MNWKRMAATAAVGALVMASALSPAFAQDQAQAKKWADNAEYELYSTANAAATTDAAKAITTLDTWKQKYPQTQYSDERDVLYLKAYFTGKQYAKVIEAAGPLMQKNLSPQDTLAVLFDTVGSIGGQALAEPNAAQAATVDTAAKKLMAWEIKKPEGVADEAWNQAKTQLQGAAKAAQYYMVVAPAAKLHAKASASKPPVKDEWLAAAAAWQKALAQYPENTYICYNLGTAWYQVARTDSAIAAEMVPKAVYEFLRAAALDPTLAGSNNNPKQVTDFATKAYVTLHGDEEGIDQLKQMAKASPLPPADLKIKTGAERDAEKEEQFKKDYPKIANWLAIKKLLTQPSGEMYFNSDMKGNGIADLEGTIVSATPACKSKEVVLSIPEPGQKDAPGVITLKFEKPLTGKPAVGSVVGFKGEMASFNPSPFMLTVNAEEGDITGWNLEKCVAAPAAAGKKGAARPAGKKK
jgi:hypothetical protein